MYGDYDARDDRRELVVEELEERVKVIVVTEDERLSSVEAKKRNDGPASPASRGKPASRRPAPASRGKQGIDEASAQIILQQYLDKLSV